MYSICTVHEKDGIAPGQLTIFGKETWASAYAQMRYLHQSLLVPIESQRVIITKLEHHVFEEKIEFQSGMEVFTANIVGRCNRTFIMFFSEDAMKKHIEEQKEYAQIFARKYKIMYISSKFEAIRYAKAINDLLDWRIKLGTVARFGKKNCIVSQQDLESIGFDSTETTEEFISWMQPIAKKMYDLAKKQLCKLNPDRAELNYIQPDDSDEE